MHERDSTTARAPSSLTALPGNILGSAPFIQDGDVSLGESGAITEYILAKHPGNGKKLAATPSDRNYTDYLYWFHFANANYQPSQSWSFLLSQLPDDNMMKPLFRAVQQKIAGLVDKRLGEADFLAGAELSAADIMIFFSLTTIRHFVSFSYDKFPNIVEYMQ